MLRAMQTPPALRMPTSTDAANAHALVFGASGQIGRRVCARLHREGWRITAVSRNAASQPPLPGVTWVEGALPDRVALPDDCTALVSCGPLDLFSQWYAGSGSGARRVVAFGSTSLHVKHDSPDPAERGLVRRLQAAETTVFDTAAAGGADATLLRPTLVYGAASDRNLTRIAGLARRYRTFVLPADAAGLRQPVHVDDLADAAMAALHAPASAGRGYDLPGGETLAYTDMVARTLASLDPPVRLWRLPGPLFDIALRLARHLGLRGAGPGVLARLRSDLVFDAGPAGRDFGYAPRRFRPERAMFVAPP